MFFFVYFMHDSFIILLRIIFKFVIFMDWELGDNNINVTILVINKINYFVALFFFLVYASNKILVSFPYKGDAAGVF
jgi:hypothetical protein